MRDKHGQIQIDILRGCNSGALSLPKSCRRSWSRVVPMFSYPDEIRRVIYTTNIIESLNMDFIHFEDRECK